MVQWSLLALIYILLFGYLGLLAFIITLGFYTLLKQIDFKEQAKEAEQLVAVEDNLFKLQKILDVNAQSEFEINNIESYDEILHSGSQDDKLELIGMVVFNPTKENVELIRIALNDKDEIVRILASNSLQKMEEYYFHETAKLNLQIKAEPNLQKKDELTLELIDIYDRFIDSGLIEPSVKAQYIKSLFECFSNIHNQENHSYVYHFFRLCIKFNRFDKIIEPLQAKIQKEYQLKDIFLLAEVYFKQNRLDDLSTLMQKIKFSEVKNSQYEQSYEYWMSYANS